jgi:rhomboid family GlyGly-CTERM serine protease
VRAWRFFAVVAGAAAATTAFPRSLGALAYVRGLVLRGELWRLATCHLVHGSFGHLAWNLGALAVVALAVGPSLGPLGWLLVSVASGLAASLGVLWLAPAVGAMAGLSAVLHGQLAAGAWATARGGLPLGWALGGLLALKLVWEQAAGALPWSAAVVGRGVAVDAHLYGAVGGLATAIVLIQRRSRSEGGTGAPAAETGSRSDRPELPG